MVISTFKKSALISFLGYFLLIAHFIGNTFQTANKHAYVPLDMLRLEKQGRVYTCNSLWTYTEGRPAFGGQLFSHLVEIALLQYPKWRVLSATCVFKAGGDVTQPISYTVETEEQGSRFRHLQITGRQLRPIVAKSGNSSVGNPLTVGADSLVGETKEVVVISGRVELVDDTNDNFKPIVTTDSTTDTLNEYFPGLDECLDSEKAKKMSSLSDYVIGAFDENSEAQEQIYTRNPYVTFSILPHPNEHLTLRRRCLLLKPEAKLIAELSESIAAKLEGTVAVRGPITVRSLTALLLAFFSDECLLETALLPVRKGLASSTVNILSVNHRISFLDLSTFDVHAPFFYAIDVKEVKQNLVYCTGQMIQGGRLYADVSQWGVLRSKTRAA